MSFGFKNNKWSEIGLDYINAFVVDSSNASNLQTLIDTHQHVRLTDGDFSASGNITLSSGQSLCGYIIPTVLGGTITIEAGSSNVVIKSVDSSELIFESGPEISECFLSEIKFTKVKTLNGRINRCTFFNFDRCTLEFDCSVSGYVRNSPMIRITSQSSSVQTIFYGNSSEPSYGNSEIMRVFLTSTGDTAKYNNLQNHRIISSDCESWNFDNNGTDGAIYARGVGEFIMSNIHGGNNSPFDTLPFFDVEADTFILNNSIIEDNVLNTSFIQPNTDFIHLYSRDHVPVINDPTSGRDVRGMHELEGEFLLDGLNQTSEITGVDSTFLKTVLSVGSYLSHSYSKLIYSQNPVGINFRDFRTGKTDERSVIQNLIDNNDIAELEGRVYYIGDSILVSDGKGIIGKGNNKTVIVGLTDDFPLIEEIKDTTSGNSTSSYYFSNFTLQGGQAGMHFAHTGTNNWQINYSVFENISFRDHDYGIHLDQFYGFDNVSFVGVNFFDCTIGFYQQPDYTPSTGETDYIMYVDKVFFGNCLFQNCATGVSMKANRANNLNTWYNCIFSRNGINADLNANNHASFIHTRFTGSTGNYIIDGRNNNMVSFFDCRFDNNNCTKSFNIKKAYIDSCNSEDTFSLFENDGSADEHQLLVTNSELNNSIGDVNDGLSIYTTWNNDSSLSKKLVKITNSFGLSLINENQ